MRTLPSDWAHLAVLALHAALATGLCVWCGPLWGVVLSLPLLAGIAGLLRERMYTAKWSSLVMCLYVGGFLVEAFASPEHRIVSTRLSVIAVLDFTAILLFVRWRRFEHRATAARVESSAGAAR